MMFGTITVSVSHLISHWCLTWWKPDFETYRLIWVVHKFW